MTRDKYQMFTVYGKQATQGSKRAFARRCKDGRIVASIVDDNPRLKHWRTVVAEQAQKHGPKVPIAGPVSVVVSFRFARPACHYGTGRNAGTIKPSARRKPIGKPDSTKLWRAVEDAMKGIIWRDDSQVVDVRIRKNYGRRYSTTVAWREIQDAINTRQGASDE